jgi:hypothetical protein
MPKKPKNPATSAISRKVRAQPITVHLSLVK